MPEDTEYRCFIGNLSWSTSDRGLKDAFEKFGNLLEAKVATDKFSGRSRGFGFVTFDEKAAMEEAIEAMNGMDLDGRNITVDRAKPQQGSGRDYDGDRSRDRGRDRDHDRSRGYDGSRGSNGGECFKCGKPGHFARECPSDGARGASMVVGGIVMVVVVMVAVMVLIEMETGLVGAAEMQVVEGGLVVTDIIVIVLDRMSAVELEVLVLDKMTFCADEPGLLLLWQSMKFYLFLFFLLSFLQDVLSSLFCGVEQYSSSVLSPLKCELGTNLQLYMCS
ncbi:hypothetical protein J1N35_026883 [Gossypium stocksii]|uniref:Uncharacterized protein n=2 Tax=Gossypium TaxID=3633 RepID=A0A9D3V9E0_9ROSI|nr:hypothetical protein J1N35_026883 [Gossypium stocksii]